MHVEKTLGVTIKLDGLEPWIAGVGNVQKYTGQLQGNICNIDSW